MLFDEIILFFEYFLVFVATEGKFLKRFYQVLSNYQAFLLGIYCFFSIKIGGYFVIIFFQFLQLFINDPINLQFRFINKFPEDLHDPFEVFFFLKFCFDSIRLQAIQEVSDNLFRVAVHLSYNNRMIELEEFINSSQHEQITAERMRKSSRLLRDAKSHQKMPSLETETGKCCKSSLSGIHTLNWRNQKYSQLLKLIRITKQQKEHNVAKSLDLCNDHNQDCFNQHFKGWKAPLESEILIAPCKELKLTQKFPTELAQETASRQDYRKERRSEFNLFKFHLKKSNKRYNHKKSKPSLAKHMLKIEEQPLPADLIRHPQFVKEGVNLEPLRKVHERLLSITPEKPKNELMERRSIPMKNTGRAKQTRAQSKSFNLSKVEVSAWTFHNIEQQH